MKQKKAQAFELFLVFSVLLLGCNVIFYAIKGNIDFSVNMQPPATIINMYQDADKFMIFAKESGKLAIMQAYYELVRAPDFKFAGNCDKESPIIEDNHIELCKIADTIDDDFATKIGDNIAKYLNSYKDEQFKPVKYSITFVDDIVNFNSEKINLHTQIEEGFFPFGANYNFNPSFSISIGELGLDNIAKAVETSQNCFDRTKSLDAITKCINQLKNFDFALNVKGDKAFFDLTTKKRFFYTENSNPLYERIAIKFFIKD